MPEEQYLIGKVTHPMFTPEGVTLFLEDGRHIVFGGSLEPHTRNFRSECNLFIDLQGPRYIIFAYTAEGKRLVNFTAGRNNCMIKAPPEPANGADAAVALLKETEQTTGTYLCDGCKRLVPQHQRHQCPSQSYAVQA